MGFISNLSIKHKITSIIIAVTLTALLISSAAFIVTDAVLFRRSLLRDLSILAEVTAANSAVTMMSSNQSSANQILSALKAQPNILVACILDPENKVFAHYFKNPLFTSAGELTAEEKSTIAGMDIGGETYAFKGGFLNYYRSLVVDNKKSGTVFFHVDLAGLHSRITLQVWISLMVMLVATTIACAISNRFQRVLAGRILDLAKTMRVVSSKHNFSIRQKQVSSDELGMLIDGFNDMLSEIEKRDAELEKRGAQLEEQVAEQTRELSKANADLIEAVGELKIAKESAKAANELKSQFLANMSHELRTPLNHVIGFTEIVLNQSFGGLNNTQAEYLRDTLASSKHLLALINDILDLARIEAGKERIELTQIPLMPLLEKSLSLVRAKAIRHRINLSNTANGIPEVIRGDERKFKQVLYNLLSNALKFTPDGGSVSLHADLIDYASVAHLTPDPSETEKYFSKSAIDFSQFEFPPKQAIRVSVTDTGIGIEAGDQARIFNPFEQVDGSSTRKFEGTGLGLSVSRTIVEMHGGAIWLESEGQNQGATFSFVWPLLQNKGEYLS